MKQEKHAFLRFFAFLRPEPNKRLNFDTPYSFFLSIHGRAAKTEPCSGLWKVLGWIPCQRKGAILNISATKNAVKESVTSCSCPFAQARGAISPIQDALTKEEAVPKKTRVFELNSPIQDAVTKEEAVTRVFVT